MIFDLLRASQQRLSPLKDLPGTFARADESSAASWAEMIWKNYSNQTSRRLGKPQNGGDCKGPKCKKKHSDSEILVLWGYQVIQAVTFSSPESLEVT